MRVKHMLFVIRLNELCPLHPYLHLETGTRGGRGEQSKEESDDEMKVILC